MTEQGETELGELQRSTSNPNREFIGWDEAILPRVVELLFDRYASDGTCDMRNTLIVLPGGLATRRLGELLTLRSQESSLILYPPKIVTIGALPEQLYVAKFPFASDLVQHLAWVEALKSVTPEVLKKVVPVPPPQSAAQQWLELGKILGGVHRELASDGFDFVSVAAAIGQHPESERWHSLSTIQRHYLDILDAQGLWDIQTARLCALKYHEPSTTQEILVVGCVDLNLTQRNFLSSICENVDVWVAAPEEASNSFDQFGCLDSENWQEYELNIPDDCLLVGNSVPDQAELTAATLAQWSDDFHVREVTVGAADGSIVSELKRELDLCSLTARYGPGSPLIQTEPVQLLSLVAKFVDSRRYADFAALVRHPAVENLLKVTKVDVPDNWLAELDRYYRSALCKNVDGFVNEDAPGHAVYTRLTKTVNRWLSKLKPRRQPISRWVQPLLAMLKTAYDRQLCDLEDPTEGPLYQAATKTCEAIVALRDIPSSLEPSMSLTELVDWILRSMSGQLVPEPTTANAVEMLGWLELTFDDAPALVVAGMHDGVVPESVNSDSFLPNGLRKQLGMLDNSRRYARDIYSLQVILNTRQRVRLIVGKTDASGDPLVPSRLLMACPLADLPSRVLHLVGEEGSDKLAPVQHRWKPVSGESQLKIPQPPDLLGGSSDAPVHVDRKWFPRVASLPETITVTAFRDYLACPYRFYLRHVLKLRAEDDAASELDAASFGVLLHETLDTLGNSPAGKSADEVEVRKFLVEQLHQLAEAKYGKNPPAAVLIQIEQAELRLDAFAPKQAQRVAEGWEIRHVEVGVNKEDNVLLGEGEYQLKLIGRIDRIDFHRETNRWAIWDYKTSESAKNPVSVHWSKAHGWTDLQLPLYRHLAEKLGVTGYPDLGYISIPKQAPETGFYSAKFSGAQLEDADNKAAEIARRIASGEFWPDEIEDVQYDDFARICQTGTQQVSVAPPSRSLHRFSPLRLDIEASELSDAMELVANPPSSSATFSPQIIRASAGTGKTYQLSNRLLRIILSGQEVEGILATTFTRKAAGEIMHRVLQRIAQACLRNEEREQLASQVRDVDCSLPACLAALKRVTRSIHRLRIGTLDSFFAQIARTFSLEMALPPGWSAMDPVQEPAFQMEAIGKMLDNHERKTLLTLVRMLAKGESSRQVAEQIRQTVANGYGAFRSTEQTAWDQLPLPEKPSEAAVDSALKTIELARLEHKKGDQQLQRLHLDASIGNWESVVSHGIYKRLDEDPPTYYRRELPNELVFALNVLVERSAAELLPIRRNQTQASYQVLESFDQEYTALTRHYRALAFSDVTHYLSAWMESDADSSQSQRLATDGQQRMEFRLDCGVHHLLLDEFQDTAPEQWKVLEPLAKPLGGKATSESSFFCVGDTKQAIYGWRGGVAEIFDSVNKSIDDVVQDELRESYRSSPKIVEAVNQVFQNLNNHSNFSGCDRVAASWTKLFPQHRTTRDDLSGYVKLQNTFKAPRDLVANEKKELLLANAADQIADLTSKTDASIGVLFRTNADVARMIGLLRQRDVSASQDGGNPLTDSVAVQLILSLMHLADHPGDKISAYHLRTSPLAKKLPTQSVQDPYSLASWFRQEVTRRGLANSIGAVADLVANDLSWWDQHRLRQLVRSADQFQPNYRGRLRDFEESVIADRIALPSDAQVKVMTIHKSKGLEFDAVFLPDLEVDMSSSGPLLVLRGDDPCEAPNGVLRYMNAALQKMLPTTWKNAFDAQKDRGVAESLCLLYVAMTRARRALYMFARPTSSPPSQEFGSLLQSTLGSSDLTATPEAIVYENGEAEWFQSIPVQSRRVDEKKALVPATIQLRNDVESAPTRGLRVSKPSGVHQDFRRTPVSSAFSYSRSVGATYGTLVHAFFEQVQWLEDFQVDRNELRRIALATIEPEALRHISVSGVIDDFEEMLNLSSVRAALSRSRYQHLTYGDTPDLVEVDNERPISMIVDDRIVSGTIDRLAVLMKDGKPYAAEVIDFKTDAFDSKMTLLWLDERIDHHRPQLEVYAQVVSKLLGIPPNRIATYLVMLSTDDLALCEQAVPDVADKMEEKMSLFGDTR